MYRCCGVDSVRRLHLTLGTYRRSSPRNHFIDDYHPQIGLTKKPVKQIDRYVVSITNRRRQTFGDTQHACSDFRIDYGVLNRLTQGKSRLHQANNRARIEIY